MLFFLYRCFKKVVVVIIRVRSGYAGWRDVYVFFYKVFLLYNDRDYRLRDIEERKEILV